MTTAAATSEVVQSVRVTNLEESPLNPRRHHDKRMHEELVASLKERGVLVPLIARGAGNGSRLEVVDGSRRLRAAIEAGLKVVPVIVREVSDSEMVETMVVANAQRADVHPLDEALGIKALLEQPGYDVATVALKIGRSESAVRRRMKLLDLTEAAQKLFLDGAITAAHADVLARLTPRDQATVIKDALFRGRIGKERIAEPARVLAAWCEERLFRTIKDAPWDPADPNLSPDAGPCTTCPKRTGNAPGLFPDVRSKETCTDAICFEEKRSLFFEGRAREIAERTNQSRPEDAEAVTPSKVLRVSTSYMADEGVLRRDEWRQATKKCATPTPGLVVLGDAVGTAVSICLDKKCKEHGGRGDGKVDKREAKRLEMEKEAQRARDRASRLDREFRVALMAEIDKTTPKRPTREDLEVATRALWGAIWAEYRKRLVVAWHGPEKPAKIDPKNPSMRVYDDVGPKFERRIKDADERGLLELLIQTALVDEARPQSGMVDRDATRMLAIAKARGIDVAKIRARVKAAAKEREQAKKPKGTGKAMMRRPRKALRKARA